VEHPVTELVCGLDLVEAQFQVAEGEPLAAEVRAAEQRGHAIEVRLYAEDAEGGYLPASGRLDSFNVLEDEGVRVDAGYASGSVVSTSYDAMLAKVIAWAPTREGAARRLATALREATIHGVTTNRDLLVGILENDEFLRGATDTAFLDRHAPSDLAAASRDPRAPLACVAAALWLRAQASNGSPQPKGIPAGWRSVGPADQPRTFELLGAHHVVRCSGRPEAVRVELDGEAVEVGDVAATRWSLTASIDGRRIRCELDRTGSTINVDGTLGALTLSEVPRLAPPSIEEEPGSMHAPLPGSVRRVAVSEGAAVSAGDVLVVLEAMKMEHAIRAPHDGVVTSILVADGDQVQGGDVLAVVALAEEAA
jgi:acetyl/propionyl-CoA carboxylase alpha subunit